MSESSISTTRRIEYIDAIKGFSILWVVIYHFNDFLPGVLPQWAQSPFRMPLFFFMSGIFFRERKSFGEFVVKKINTLIVPFIFFYCAGKTYQACFSLASATAGKGEFHFD